jgi:hypothetical protein
MLIDDDTGVAYEPKTILIRRGGRV